MKRIIFSIGSLVLTLGVGACQQAPSPTPTPLEPMHVFSGSTPEPFFATFSDADEVVGSASRVEAHMSEYDQHGALLLNYQIERYGGVAFPVPSFNAYPYTAIRFRAALLDGTMPEISVQFENAHGQRKHVGVTSYFADLDDAWKTFDIPIGQFMFFNPVGLDDVVKVSLVMHPGTGVLGLKQISLIRDEAPEAHTWEKPPYVTPSPLPLPRGHGVWCYGSAPWIVEQVQQYNASAPAAAQIRYLFPLLGTVTFHQGSYALRWDPDRGHHMYRLLQEAGLDDVLILPMIDGLTHGAHQMTPDAWQELAREMAGLYDSDPAFYGIHLDIEPHDNVLHTLFSALRAYSEKPISAAVGHGDTELFQYTDFAVLMAYDLAADPAGYRLSAEALIAKFLADARAVNRRAMIGVPAIATHREYESIASAPEGPREETGHSMSEFVREAIEAVRAHSDPGDSACMGLSIWAFHEPDGLHGPQDVLWYYPTVISEDSWQLIKDPFADR